MKKIILLLILSSLFSCEKNQEEKPPIDLKLLESQGSFPFPHEDPDNWLMAHIDVETTGLLPGWHEMIDVGLVITDLKGNVKDSLFLRVMPDHPERCSEIAAKVNGFAEDKWKKHQALSEAEAVKQWIAFHQRVAGDKGVIFTAYNSHFDLSFTDQLFRKTGHSWRELYFYFVLDIPSMAWGQGYRELYLEEFMKEKGIQDEPHTADEHTGITGAMKNVRIYKRLVELSQESRE
jgi:DNA polymerase III epsilon subunit-like protein